MTNSALAAIGRLRKRTARHAQAACVASCLAVAGLSVAGQTGPLRKTTMKSGPHTLVANRIMKVTVTDVGDPSAVSQVQIEVRDASDRLVARDGGQLTTKTPVGILVPVPPDGRPRSWRAVITVTSSTPVDLTNPITVMEDVDMNGQAPRVLAQAAVPPKPPEGPGGAGEGAKTMCPGSEFWITAE